MKVIGAGFGRTGTESMKLALEALGAEIVVEHGFIKARAQRMREISRQLANDFRAGQRGSVRPALTIEDGTVAVTDNYFRVAAPAGHSRNEWIEVTL